MAFTIVGTSRMCGLQSFLNLRTRRISNLTSSNFPKLITRVTLYKNINEFRRSKSLLKFHNNIHVVSDRCRKRDFIHFIVIISERFLKAVMVFEPQIVSVGAARFLKSYLCMLERVQTVSRPIPSEL